MKRKRSVAAGPANTEPDLASAPVHRPAGNRFVRWAANLWVVFHFAAVLAAVNTVGPTSDLLLAAWQPFRPYLQALFLNHGYNFYAPQPAPSTLLAYQVQRGDGTTVRGRVLDRSTKPRLLYHRYLLLTEHLVFVSPDMQQYWYKSYARHLCRKYGGSRVSLTRLIHYPPTMEMVRNGATLDESFTYEEMSVGEFSCSEF
jgi:hypothetical protein